MWVDCGSESHAERTLLKSKELTQRCSPLYAKALADSRVGHWGHGPGNTAQESCRKLAMVPWLVRMLWETWEEGNTSKSNGSFPWSLFVGPLLTSEGREAGYQMTFSFWLMRLFSLLLCLPANGLKSALPLLCSKILSMVYTVIHSGGSR